MVMVDVPEPAVAVDAGLMDAGLNVTVTPAGSPEAARAIADLKPPETVVARVAVPLLPGATETDADEAEMLKLGADEIAASVVIRPVPFGLPHPVTRS